MKKFLLAVSLLCLVVACGGASPEATVQKFFDAVKAKDGETAVGLLSQASIDEMSSGLEELKADTTGFALSMLTGMLGVEVTPEELANMDGRDFAALLFSSDMVASEIGGGTFEIFGSEIEGDNAVVNVRMTMNGESDEEELELVREGGSWKLNLEGMGM
ncbi:DUF4878 domain-containing protein [Candidatus Fermentibacteria bacterium]|nr:DUF4878 domain-containing protein [Candidatus Fermentibacteria bacterium]